jgi:carbonic anhydrase
VPEIHRLIAANEGYAAARAGVADPRPNRQLAIVTCMDARIDVFVDTVVVMQHTKCGIAGRSDAELQEITGADLGFLPIMDHAVALRDDLDRILGAPFLDPVRVVAGFVYDVESGEISDVIRSDRD